MKITTEMFDPIPVSADELQKHRHLFNEGERVTVADGAHRGRSGNLEGVNAHGGHVDVSPVPRVRFHASAGFEQ